MGSEEGTGLLLVLFILRSKTCDFWPFKIIVQNLYFAVLPVD